ANLPYNVATPLLVESLDGLPNIERWCVMVQREVADRLFASPSTKAYGAVSVLVQLVCERTGFHPVSRTVFPPPPNVASALIALLAGPVRHDGKHELLTVYQRLGLADRIELEPAERLRVDGFEGDTLVRDALELLAAHAAVDRRWRVRIEKRVPVAAGLGGGS